MRAVIQRSQAASVSVDGEIVGFIDKGLVVLLGVAPTDTNKEVRWLAEKIANLRIFRDDADKMNRSLLDVDSETGNVLKAKIDYPLKSYTSPAVSP